MRHMLSLHYRRTRYALFQKKCHLSVFGKIRNESFLGKNVSFLENKKSVISEFFLEISSFWTVGGGRKEKKEKIHVT